MQRLEHLCVQYLESTVSYNNVLEALLCAHNLKLAFIKELCMKLIVRESNYTQIVMSREFETLEQPLMVEIIRRKQLPQVKKNQEGLHHSHLSHHPQQSNQPHQHHHPYFHPHENHGKLSICI